MNDPQQATPNLYGFDALGDNQYLRNDSCLHALEGIESGFFDAIITDPPYSSGGLHVGQRNTDPRHKYRASDASVLEPSFDGDQRDQRSWILWCTLWLEACYRVTRRGGYCALCIDWRQLPALTDAVQVAGWTWGGIMSWDKGAGCVRPQLGWLQQRCEFIVFGRKGNTSDAADARNMSLTLQAYHHERSPNAAGGRWHLTEKPVGLMRHVCGLVRDGGRVLDPFVGSGTTLEACRQLGLEGWGIEMESAYCDRIRERLSQPMLLTAAPKKRQDTVFQQSTMFSPEDTQPQQDAQPATPSPNPSLLATIPLPPHDEARNPQPKGPTP